MATMWQSDLEAEHSLTIPESHSQALLTVSGGDKTKPPSNSQLYKGTPPKIEARSSLLAFLNASVSGLGLNSHRFVAVVGVTACAPVF